MVTILKKIDHVCLGGFGINDKLIITLELEDKTRKCQIQMQAGPFRLNENAFKFYLPSIHQFEIHSEWNNTDELQIDQRFKEAVYMYYVLKGYEEESTLDKDTSIKTILNSEFSDLYSFKDRIEKLYYFALKELMKYAECINGTICELLFKTMDSLFTTRNIGITYDYIECILFVYGLYVEILEIYDPKKQIVSTF